MSTGGEEAFNKTTAPGDDPGNDAFNKAFNKTNFPGDDAGVEAPGDNVGNTDRFLPCWILFLVRTQIMLLTVI